MNTISFVHTLDKVLSGEKTQTRRIVKPTWMKTPEGIVNVKPQFDDIKTSDVFRVGGVHTVVGGRGKGTVWWVNEKNFGIQTAYFAKDYWGEVGDDTPYLALIGYRPLQIRVTRIRVEDVRLITPEDVKAEGFTDYIAFMRTYCYMHDKTAHKAIDPILIARQMVAVGRPNYLEDVIYGMLKERPDNRYQAVVLDFEVVR